MPSKPSSPAQALLTAVAVLAGSSALADDHAPQIVKWTDETGHIHFSDHAPSGHTRVTEVSLHDPLAIGGNSPSASPRAADTRPGNGASSDHRSVPDSRTADSAPTAEAEPKKQL